MTTSQTLYRQFIANVLLMGAMLAPFGIAQADSKGEDKTMVLVEFNFAGGLIDVPAQVTDGAAGDIAFFESTLSRNGVAVGKLAGHCIQLRTDGTLDNCDVVVTIGNNSFHMAGLFDPRTGGTFAITGGTGEWVGAAGTDTIANQPDGTAIHTIRLKRR